MRELGLEVSPVTVAQRYRDVLTGFVLDRQDEALRAALATELGLHPLVTDTVMRSDAARIQLARQVLEFAAQL
jgi:LPPG:FO 2-phospho-L-lactate transferase